MDTAVESTSMVLVCTNSLGKFVYGPLTEVQFKDRVISVRFPEKTREYAVGSIHYFSGYIRYTLNNQMFVTVTAQIYNSAIHPDLLSL